VDFFLEEKAKEKKKKTEEKATPIVFKRNIQWYTQQIYSACVCF
jgi:hypothetical protein